ncbi:MAG TPA: DUF4350 domain-containing protein [Candidatus Thermoplasmatota archaeon]
MKLKPVVAVVALLLGVVFYGVIPLLLSPPPDAGALQPFDEDYDDLGQFSQLVEQLSLEADTGGARYDYKVATLVGSPTALSGLADPTKIVYFAPGVSRDYRAEETEALVDFNKRGGRLLIADDFGYGNTLAQRFGIFYFGTDLWDLEVGRFDRNISLPLVPFTFAGSDYWVELNAPTGITLIENPEVSTTVIAHCSDKCYADIDRSGTVNIGDKKGNITVIMRAQLLENRTIEGASVLVPTKGEAYFISDASVFSNEMLGKPDNVSLGNRDFAKALIRTMLPEGGTLVIDMSRHLHEPGTQVVYSSFEAGTIATSRAELAAALISGSALALAILVLRAKDRESWIHHFDLSTFHPRAQLPETLPIQVERLRAVARLKVQMTHSMGDEEFAALPQDELRTMIKDPMLIDLILNPGRTWVGEEMRAVGDHIRAWGR